MSKRKNLMSKSPSVKKNGGQIVLGLIIAVILAVPVSLALATVFVQSSAETDMIPAPHEAADPKTQFQVHIAYAYVGPAPSSVSMYFEEATNATMRLVSQYPSVARLNITSIPDVQIVGCDAAVEVYGVKIATDTGPVEYHAYFVGTNYNPSFSDASQSILIQYVINLVDVNLYSSVVGNFRVNWTSSTSLLTNPIGSITKYTSAPSSALGLSSGGEPKAVSVTVYRIGYITITNDSVTLFEDPSNSTPKDMVQLNNYKSGFLHNDIVPSAQLPQENFSSLLIVHSDLIQ